MCKVTNKNQYNDKKPKKCELLSNFNQEKTKMKL